jgi:hypothetical protein
MSGEKYCEWLPVNFPSLHHPNLDRVSIMVDSAIQQWALRLDAAVACDQLEFNVAWDLASNLILESVLQDSKDWLASLNEEHLLGIYLQSSSNSWSTLLAGGLLSHALALRLASSRDNQSRLLSQLLHKIWAKVSHFGAQVSDNPELVGKSCQIYHKALQEVCQKFSGCFNNAVVAIVDLFATCIECVRDGASLLTANTTVLPTAFVDDDNKLHPTFCVQVMSYLLACLGSSQGLGALASVMCAKGRSIIPQVTSIYCAAANLDFRNEITKRLLNPMVMLVGKASDARVDSNSRDCVEEVWSLVQRLSEQDSDLVTASMVLCILFTSLPTEMYQFLAVHSDANHVVWKIILLGMLHKEGLVRKRSAYMLQSVSSAVVAANSVVPVRSKAKQHAKVEEPWTSQFLQVYGQIEGSNSMHLISQVWSIFDNLCVNATRNHSQLQPSITDAQSHLQIPFISFPWIKSILHTLMHCQVPSVRRIALYKILSGSVPLIVSVESIYWLCFELLGDLADDITYFSAYFIGRAHNIGIGTAIQAVVAGTEGGCLSCNEMDGSGSRLCVLQFPKSLQQSIEDTIADCRSPLQVQTSPGVLLPSYLAGLLAACRFIDSENGNRASSLSEGLIRCMVHSLCRPQGICSLSAVKWLLRTFADEAVQLMMPRCLGQQALGEIRAYLAGKVLNSNGAVRVQIMQGLVPLLLCAVDNSNEAACEISDEWLDAVRRSTNSVCWHDATVSVPIRYSTGGHISSNVCLLVKIVMEQIGLESIVSYRPHLKLLKSALQPLGDIGRVPAPGAEQSDSIDYSCIAVAACCLEISLVTGEMNTSRDTWNLLSESERCLSEVSKLQTSPYMSAVARLRAVSFAEGVLQCVSLSVDALLASSAGAVQELSSKQLALHPQLPALFATIGDFASFLSVNIFDSIRTSLSNEHCSKSLGFIRSERALDQASESLGGCMLLTALFVYLQCHVQCFGPIQFFGDDKDTHSILNYLNSSSSPQQVRSSTENVFSCARNLLHQLFHLPRTQDRWLLCELLGQTVEVRQFSAMHRCKLLLARADHIVRRCGKQAPASLLVGRAALDENFPQFVAQVCGDAMSPRDRNYSDRVANVFRSIREDLRSSSQHQSAATTPVGLSLLSIHVIECDQASKHLVKSLRVRWSLVHNSLLCLKSFSTKSTTHVSSEGFGSDLESSVQLCRQIVKQAVDQAEVCPPDSLVDLLACIATGTQTLLNSVCVQGKA